MLKLNRFNVDKVGVSALAVGVAARQNYRVAFFNEAAFLGYLKYLIPFCYGKV